MNKYNLIITSSNLSACLLERGMLQGYSASKDNVVFSQEDLSWFEELTAVLCIVSAL